jgi:hypothetical protein
VARKLALQWSPEQISGWLKRQFPADEDMQISHEAIYRSLFVQTRGVLKKELTPHLRTRHRMRLPKRDNVQSGQGQILDMVSIRERPAEAEDRAVPLGRRPSYWRERYAHRHTDWAPQPVYDVDQASSQRQLLLRFSSTSANCLRSCGVYW